MQFTYHVIEFLYDQFADVPIEYDVSHDYTAHTVSVVLTVTNTTQCSYNYMPAVHHGHETTEMTPNLILKPSFPQSLSNHSHLSIIQVHLLESDHLASGSHWQW